MLDTLSLLGRTLGFSFAAGINLYATVAVLGLSARFGWVDLPPQFDLFAHDIVIAAALGMYAVEFLADKIPWVDSIWDAVHTLIRPLGGAFLAVVSVGEATPAAQGLAALLGGGVATSTHLAKAGTRAMINASPEPVSNWTVSLGEDVFVVGLGLLALRYPLLAFGVATALLIVIGVFAAVIVRFAHRRWTEGRASRGDPDLTRPS